MRLAVILPNTKLYGGVKRFFELGDALLRMGHTLVVFSPQAERPDWYEGDVEVASIDTAYNRPFEAAFITETQFLPVLTVMKAVRKILYFVRPSDSLKILKRYPDVEVFANSTNSWETARSKYGIEAFQAYGGVNTKAYFPKTIQPTGNGEPVVVLTYGRIVEKKKGTMLVVKACERLQRRGYNLKLLLFDTPVNEKAERAIRNFKASVPFEFVVGHPVGKNVELYHRADIFVSAERKAGYSNTSAEAMASGLPVIGTTSGTRDFLLHRETGLVVSRWSWRIASAIAMLIDDFELRRTLAHAGRRKIEEYNWDTLAARIVEHLDGSRGR